MGVALKIVAGNNRRWHFDIQIIQTFGILEILISFKEGGCRDEK
jgi:hypothetical protein